MLRKGNRYCTARLDKDARWNSIFVGRKIQKTLANDLHQRAGVPLKHCGIEEVKPFQMTLKDYQISILSSEHDGAIIYAGPEVQNQHDGHYDVITSIPEFLTKQYYCKEFRMGYDDKEKHRCSHSCVHCHQIHEELSKK